MRHLSKFSALFLSLAIIGSSLLLSRVNNQPAYATGQETCPNSSPWVKVDNLKHKSYSYTAPTGMVIAEVCYKASTTVVYLAGNYQNTFTVTSTVTNQNGKVQDLSHASFKLTPAPSPSPSLTSSPSPSLTPRPSHLCSPSPSPSQTPTLSPSPSLTPAPSEDPSESPEPSPSVSPEPSEEPQASPSPSPSAASSATPAPSSSSSGSSDNNTSSSDNNSSSSSSQGEGEVLGAYAGTGIVEDSLFTLMNPLGGLMFGTGTILYGKKNKKK